MAHSGHTVMSADQQQLLPLLCWREGFLRAQMTESCGCGGRWRGRVKMQTWVNLSQFLV
eukprot:COSAG01_NODE_2970_length_6775_cov_8.832235_9_plen_59_part_00